MEALAAPETAGQLREQESASLQEPSVQIIDQEDISSAKEQTPGETLPGQKTPSLNTSEQVNRPAKKPVAASFSPQVPQAKTAEVEIPKLNDPDMKLQAITWSRVPQKRIAVINNRILREGEIVSGYLINTINQDDVVLSQDGEKWKLFFR